MGKSKRLTVVVDPDVFRPIYVRELLLWFAANRLYTPKFSNQIRTKFRLILKDLNLPSSYISRAVVDFRNAFHDAEVKATQEKIRQFGDPSLDSSICYAVADICQADCIISLEIEKYPPYYSVGNGPRLLSADEFLLDLMDRNKNLFILKWLALVQLYYTEGFELKSFIARYEYSGLPLFSERIRHLLD